MTNGLHSLQDLTFQVQARKRPDRHPYQLGCLIGLVSVAISQIVIGVPPESILYGAVRYSTIVMLDTCFVVGATFALLGAALHRDRDPRLSLRLGIAGQFPIFVGMVVYTVITITVTGVPYWLSILSGGLGFGLTYASAHRMIQQWRALRDLKKMVNIIQPDELPL